jgi:hypothetical protein
MCRACGRALWQKKNFFFEKKKQKTFVPALSSPGVNQRQLAHTQTEKSLSVLFFKKERLPYFFFRYAPS